MPRSCAVKLVTCSDVGHLLVPPGWNVGERSDLPGNLRLMGHAAASGPHHLGPGPLLGLYESQPAPPELHVDPSPAFHRWLTGCRENCQKRKDGIFIESNSGLLRPSICWCLVWMLGAVTAISIHPYIP